MRANASSSQVSAGNLSWLSSAGVSGGGKTVGGGPLSAPDVGMSPDRIVLRFRRHKYLVTIVTHTLRVKTKMKADHAAPQFRAFHN